MKRLAFAFLFAVMLTNVCTAQQSRHAVEVLRDVVYRCDTGFWVSNPYAENDICGQLRMLCHTHRHDRQLHQIAMDVYRPRSGQNHPTVLLMHGGAFFLNNKGSEPIVSYCKYLASLGYVAISIDYRMGFAVSRRDIRRAEQEALQDLRHAVRYVLSNATTLHADTSRLFVGGASSGAITVLRYACRPQPDTPTLRGVINLWGAVNDLSMLDDLNAPILSIQGDRDRTVPFGEGYPVGGRCLMDKMYGCSLIHAYLRQHRHPSQLVAIPDAPHAPWRDPHTRERNQHYYTIRQNIATFLGYYSN